MIESYVEERHEFGKEELPVPPPGVMYVFYEEDKPVSVSFLCPCGCGSECYTPLLQGNDDPKWVNRRWGYKKGPNGPTLTPSIRFTGGCKAHFNITDGKTIVHSDSGK